MNDADTRTGERARRRPTSERRGGTGGGQSRLTAVQAARTAVEQLVELTGRRLESVVGIRSEDEKFVVVIEAVEDPRVPSTADVMAEYEVELDDHGELLGYRRTSRYIRGSTDDG
ncbi:gas vesicle protein [Promicromonospora sp. NPDC060204]|uniref:gas vesicle protein GvpO n=1 Tax=Promicromonospora sp. NPDC060204 TaxID=3347071 RepID=UPI00365C95EA